MLLLLTSPLPVWLRAEEDLAPCKGQAAFDSGAPREALAQSEKNKKRKPAQVQEFESNEDEEDKIWAAIRQAFRALLIVY